MDTAVTRADPAAGQFRAARAMLGWSLIETARRADVSPISVLALEKEMSTAPERSRRAITDVYEAIGMSFHGSVVDGFGLTLKPRSADLSSSTP